MSFSPDNAIEVSDLHKTFRVPEHRVETLKERVVHPLRQIQYRELRSLQGISFDVRDGEFFGIVGRNGSGKSTLLKILASIYRIDSGRVQVAGRIAPFIELGVGFNPDLTARDNIMLNAVMMGLSRKEARAAVGAVIEFAELEEFAEMKLKNYSSGMLVRLGFSVMIEADADIMLVDEILAVGDAAFRQKCRDAFQLMQDQGKTIVLVTHDMGSIEKLCDRAMLIQDGVIRQIGDPTEVGDSYMRTNFRKDVDQSRVESGSDIQNDAEVVDVWIEDEQGQRVTNIEGGTSFRINVVIEAGREIPTPGFRVLVTDDQSTSIFSFEHRLAETEGSHTELKPGDRIQISAEVRNVLKAGRYFIGARAYSHDSYEDLVMRSSRILDFVVYGTSGGPGLVDLTPTVKLSRSESEVS